jgi:aryl-alcohol dehydrogenase-like predicted oxidoreductase
VEAQWTAERRGHQRFRSEQPPYSILLRGIESAVLPTARRHGMGVLTYGPLSSGWLSGRAEPTADSRRAALGSRMFDPLTHLATAFVRAHPAVTSVIVGPRTPDHLTDLLAGDEVALSEDVLNRIDEIVPPGANLNQDDIYYTPPALEDKTLRRR